MRGERAQMGKLRNLKSNGLQGGEAGERFVFANALGGLRMKVGWRALTLRWLGQALASSSSKLTQDDALGRRYGWGGFM